jgi:L-lysine 2,3-aminomutase
MSCIYMVFEHLKQLSMGIWLHIHVDNTTEVSQDLREFTEILDDVSVEMIPLHYC